MFKALYENDTVNREIFVVKIFSDSMDSMGNVKIKLCALLTLIQYGVVYPKIV